MKILPCEKGEMWRAVKKQAILTLGDFHVSLRDNEGLIVAYLQQV